MSKARQSTLTPTKIHQVSNDVRPKISPGLIFSFICFDVDIVSLYWFVFVVTATATATAVAVAVPAPVSDFVGFCAFLQSPEISCWIITKEKDTEAMAGAGRLGNLNALKIKSDFMNIDWLLLPWMKIRFCATFSSCFVLLPPATWPHILPLLLLLVWALLSLCIVWPEFYIFSFYW